MVRIIDVSIGLLRARCAPLNRQHLERDAEILGPHHERCVQSARPLGYKRDGMPEREGGVGITGTVNDDGSKKRRQVVTLRDIVDHLPCNGQPNSA